MSVRERREDSFASPERARSLLTVRAAISFAFFFGVPRSSRLSSMCSYWRSRFFDHACGMRTTSFGGGTGDTPLAVTPLRLEGLVLDVVLGRVRVHELVHHVHAVA